MMNGNCGKRRLKGNLGLNLTAVRSGWWIEKELQNCFQRQCEMEFRILGSDDGLPGFSGWERKMGIWKGGHEAVQLIKYMKFHHINGVGKIPQPQ
jgi:hypothetical protein